MGHQPHNHFAHSTDWNARVERGQAIFEALLAEALDGARDFAAVAETLKQQLHEAATRLDWHAVGIYTPAHPLNGNADAMLCDSPGVRGEIAADIAAARHIAFAYAAFRALAAHEAVIRPLIEIETERGA